MRSVALASVLLLAIGCGEDTETKKDSTGTDKSGASEPAKGSSTGEAIAKEPVKKPVKKPAQPAADAPKVDCDALLPIEDLKAICGQEGKWKSAISEGQGVVLCSRKAGKPGANLYFNLENLPTEAAARVRTAQVEEGKTKFRVSKGGAMVTESAFARKGRLAVIVNNQLMGAGKKSMCSARQLAQLAEKVAGRLP